MKLFFTIFLVSCFFFSFAQKQDYNWCFGDSVGINFNTVQPSIFQSSMNSTECAAGISDNNGNLLFYVGGYGYDNGGQPYIEVWNKAHQFMENSNNIIGHTSITMGALIIPFANDTNKFYLFHIGSVTGMSLYYSVIDLSFNNGLGKVISKNNLLYSTNEVTEKLIAVKHANGRDWWVIIHERGNNTFVRFLVANDIISAPFPQTLGSVFSNSYGGYMGEMEATKDGNKIASTNLLAVVDLFDFDRCTGNLSNWLNLSNYAPNYFAQLYSCAFSPKGDRLYVTQLDTLFQYDLTASSIIDSKQTIWVNPYQSDHDFGQIQLAPDSKIYVTNVSGTGFPNSIFDTINMNLSVINNPEGIGLACDFQPYSFNLEGKRSYFSLPNMPNYNLGALEGSTCDTLTLINNTLEQEKIKIYPNPITDLLNIEVSDFENMKIQIINCSGKILINFDLHFKITEFDLSRFSKGLYILKIISIKNVIIKKIIKT